ncbi:M48 family metallopeptidase [Leptolyngbya sp. 15MV]|nr:M48 family metallopeptidase [Leptolyngbya sp. 15MV]
MIDWLRRPASDDTVEVAGRALPITIRRHPSARRMTLRLAPDGSEVRLSIPRWGRTADALAFAHSRAEWLTEQLAALPRPQVLEPGATILFRGEPVRIEWAAHHPRTPSLGAAVVRLGGPEDALGARVRRWLEGQALALIACDLDEYCAAAGVPVPPLRLSRAQRRWGSCSGDGTVRINWRLVHAPDMVRRSVVAHEVAHLVHFDHSRQFHALLADLYGPGLGEAERWLREHGRTLYVAG